MTIDTNFDLSSVPPKLRAKVARAVMAAIRGATPVRTGRRAGGWRSEQLGSTLRVLNDVPNAVYVNDGTPRMAPRDMTGAGRASLGDLA